MQRPTDRAAAASTLEDEPVVVELGAVAVAVQEEAPRVLVRRAGSIRESESRSVQRGFDVAGDALPSGQFDPTQHRTLEIGLRDFVRDQAGIRLGYVEQLYTFGDRGRHPVEREGGPRVVSVGYLALSHSSVGAAPTGNNWKPWYAHFPWEDWRDAAPRIVADEIVPALSNWANTGETPGEREIREDRMRICFGLDGTGWDEEKVLERYELLFEAGLVAEAQREHSGQELRYATAALAQKMGAPMMSDHRRILATAMGRLRAKVKYRPVVFELMPPAFTLFQLQRTVEAVAGVRVHKQNFRRLVERSGLVETTGDVAKLTGGRPAAQYRYRPEVLRERLAPGVRVPSPRSAL
ncbi:MAG: NAD regulator [Myxococcota bacterium]